MCKTGLDQESPRGGAVCKPERQEKGKQCVHLCQVEAEAGAVREQVGMSRGTGGWGRGRLEIEIWKLFELEVVVYT